jgi:acetylornithine deacetylase/succinyl-diaminopimelate desuccinylase-like protein
LGVKTILMGFGLESDAIHSPNESFLIENFINGIRSVVQFYRFYGEEMVQGS